MKILGKITLASGGLGLAVLLAGGSVDNKSTAAKSIQPTSLVAPALAVSPVENTPAEAANPDLPNFATVFQTNNPATENHGGSLAVSTGGVSAERRQLMISRLQTIAK